MNERNLTLLEREPERQKASVAYDIRCRKPCVVMNAIHVVGNMSFSAVVDLARMIRVFPGTHNDDAGFKQRPGTEGQESSKR